MVYNKPGNPCGNVIHTTTSTEIVDCITGYLNISCDAPTFIQGAVPDILGKTKEDFFSKILAQEESVIILPGKTNPHCLNFLPSSSGIAVGLKNWLRVTFAIEPSALEEGIKRLKAFCERHSKNA
ncbi:tyrosine aminotransferase-like protein [Tanacetum coccineum]